MKHWHSDTGRPKRLLLAWVGLLVAASAQGHAFVAPYTLPVPFAIYAYGASAALILSFVASALSTRSVGRAVVFTGGSSERGHHREWPVPRVLLLGGRTLGFSLLALAIISGLFGTRNAFRNFNMTFFWIVLVLGLTYAVALFGNLYRILNPWLCACLAVERLRPGIFQGRRPYPGKLAYYPAVVLFGAFIWMELFGHTNPRSLSWALVTYSAITLAGAYVFGASSWLRKGEFFGVFFEVASRTSSISWRASTDGHCVTLSYRRLFSGLIGRRAHMSLVLFILFMLSSTAFDGIHATQIWSRAYWGSLHPLYEPLLPQNSLKALSVSTSLFYAFQWVALCLSPFVYLVVFLGFLAVSGAMGRWRGTAVQLASRFAYSLIPIAIVYHVSHYFTMLVDQGPQIVKLASDPMGLGWNLFGTSTWVIPPIIIDANIVWHVQVSAIVIGHIVSVYVAHVEAMKVFSTSANAARSQIPMLGLMMVFTTFGLWILSLPLG